MTTSENAMAYKRMRSIFLNCFREASITRKNTLSVSILVSPEAVSPSTRTRLVKLARNRHSFLIRFDVWAERAAFAGRLGR